MLGRGLIIMILIGVLPCKRTVFTVTKIWHAKVEGAPDTRIRETNAMNVLQNTPKGKIMDVRKPNGA